MRAKVFVSYKYADNSVAQLPSLCKWGKVTTARNYVDIFIHRAQKKNIIVYKGEMNGEDLSDFSKDYIWNTLKDRIFDSSLTIVFISPNMMELYKKEDSQWIPQEIAFSLKESTRNGRTSHSNALLFVVLPDSYGATNYITYMNHFEIIRRNIDNKYGVLTTWGNFINNIENCLNLAYEKAQKSIPYKQINNKENIYMTPIHEKRDYQAFILERLKENGYEIRTAKRFDKKYAIDRELIFKFLNDTQPDQMETLKNVYKDATEETLINFFNKEITKS